MDIAVSTKTGRRRGETKEHIQDGSVTEQQRSRRPVFVETLRAEVLLVLRFVATRSQIRMDMLPRRAARKTKIPLSGNVHSFSAAC